MRIAVFHNLPPGGALRTATEQFARLGDQVVAAFVPDGDSREGLPDSAKVHSFTLRRNKQFGSPFGRLNGLLNIMDMNAAYRLGKKISADIDNGNYDVILAHPCAITQAPWIFKYVHTPTVYYCHEPFRVMHEALNKGGVFYPWTDPFRALFSRLAVSAENSSLHSATDVLCNSYYTHEYLLRTYGINSYVNYPGVNTNVFHPVKIPKKNIVLSVGRLSFLKGHEFVIDSLSCLPGESRPVLHIVCGSGNSPKTISAVNQYASDRSVKIELQIDISDEKLVELYCSSIASLVAPILEPLGLVPLESMACGTPVVGIAEGGIRETVIDRVTGLHVNRDPMEFAHALSFLIANPDKVAEMGKAGIEHAANNWSWEKSMNGLQHALHKAIEAKK